MNKKLIYYWYVPAEWDGVYDLHLRNIKLYFPMYDFKEKLFVICYDKGDYTISPYVLKTIDKIREVVPDAKFVFYDNDPILRECKYFYNELAMKLGEFDKDDVIFYAHAKGKFSGYVPNKARDLWVNLMYFGNLYNRKTIEEFIDNKDNLCLGTLCWDTTNAKLPHEEFNIQRYKWHYSGTFFWFKPYQISEYIKENDLTIPENSRYFSECFLGNIIPPDDNKRIKSYGDFAFNYNKFINNMPEDDKKAFIITHKTLLSYDGKIEHYIS